MARTPWTSFRALCCAALLSAACSTRVDPSNPHDPGTPAAQQARGKITGVVNPLVLPGGGEKVKLTGSGVPTTTTTAGSDGSFSFDQLAPDTYFLEVQIDGFQTVIRPGVLVVAGAVVDVGTLTPIPIGNANGQIGGTLHFDNGKPAAGASARIALHVGNTDTFVAEVPSDAAGTYAALVQPGSYVVTGVHPLYLSKASTPQPVVAGQVTAVAPGLGAASTTTSAFWTCCCSGSRSGTWRRGSRGRRRRGRRSARRCACRRTRGTSRSAED